MLLIGLMSGTSADGVDAALVEIEGEGRGVSLRLVHFVSVPFEPSMRAAVLRLCAPGEGTAQEICALNSALGELFADASLRVAHEAGVELDAVAAICSHGQTIWHQPQAVEVGGMVARGTLQIGSPAVIAARTGCKVVSDFRSADMAAGGQGAPLVPYFDWAVLTSETECRAVLNLGGIANLTYLPKAAALDQVLAFDTGPGNMLIDAAIAHYSNGSQTFDRNGEWAARGTWSPELGEELLREPYFPQAPPKSTGRELFGEEYAGRILERAANLRLTPEDTVATLTELTARTIADAVARWLPSVDRVIAGGGGVQNCTLIANLTKQFAPMALSTHEEFGIPSDAKEAMAFALLGYETLHGRPSNVSSATGAGRPVILGSITPAPGDSNHRFSSKGGNGG
jgi:anhydro-N-acetylmuramic acid kinase